MTSHIHSEFNWPLVENPHWVKLILKYFFTFKCIIHIRVILETAGNSLYFVPSSKISYLISRLKSQRLPLKYLIYFRNSKWSMYQPFWWYSLYILYQSERDFFWLSVFFWGEKFWWFHGWLLVRYLWHFGLSIFQGRGTIFANFRPKKFRGAVKKWQNLNFKDNYLFQKLSEHVQWFFTENYQFRSSFFKYFIF